MPRFEIDSTILGSINRTGEVHTHTYSSVCQILVCCSFNRSVFVSFGDDGVLRSIGRCDQFAGDCGCFAVLEKRGDKMRLERPCHMGRASFLLSASAAINWGHLAAVADDKAQVGTAAATVTERVRLEFVEQINAEESRMLPITVGLFGKDAPQVGPVALSLCLATGRRRRPGRRVGSWGAALTSRLYTPNLCCPPGCGCLQVRMYW